MADLKLSIILKSGARIGPGKARLLESIRDTGSISAAAREMGMSYKRAWLLLDSINQAFDEPAVIAVSGGQRGGGAALTTLGSELLTRYRRIEAKARDDFAADLRKFEKAARHTHGSKI
jgi:molybdate transport system regulatory protein